MEGGNFFVFRTFLCFCCSEIGFYTLSSQYLPSKTALFHKKEVLYPLIIIITLFKVLLINYFYNQPFITIMLKNLFLAAVCALLWTACSTPAPTPEENPTEESIIESNNRSSEGDLIGRESDLIFARKWKNDNNTFLMDFRLDGSFVGEVDGHPLDGQWSISEDQKTLQLRKGENAEGKGDSFNQDYTIVSSSAEKVTLMNAAGQEVLLVSVEG